MQEDSFFVACACRYLRTCVRVSSFKFGYLHTDMPDQPTSSQHLPFTHKQRHAGAGYCLVEPVPYRGGIEVCCLWNR